MPDIVSDDELNALAAEYVLGTLDYEERKGASALLEVDPTFRGIVRIWERRFGELHLMVESVEPDPQLWMARIRPKVPGMEQVPLAIPSHADALAAAIAAAPAAETVVTEPKTDASPAGASAPAASEPPPPASVAPTPTNGAPIPTSAAPPPASMPVAIAETELKLAELAALLPVVAAAQESAAQQEGSTAPEEQPPEDGLPERAAEEIPRGFVPPAPMSTRGAPLVIEKPVARTGRGWMAATLAMGLVAVVLASLISAWRFFPDRLPPQLRAYSVLNLNPPPPPPPPQKARPKLPAFDE
jgi:hypothetical protein